MYEKPADIHNEYMRTGGELYESDTEPMYVQWLESQLIESKNKHCDKRNVSVALFEKLNTIHAKYKKRVDEASHKEVDRNQLSLVSARETTVRILLIEIRCFFSNYER